MLEVIHAMYTFHQYILDVYFHDAPDQALEDFVNHSLERVSSILESEGYHFVDFSVSSEGCLVFIWWVHLDLTMPEIDVHEVKELVARRRLYQLIDPQKRITLLGASFIEVGKVDTNSPFAILFLHENGIGELIGIEHLSNEGNLK